MTTDLALVAPTSPSLPTERLAFSSEQVTLLKRTYFRDLNDAEVAIALHIAQRVGLDPFARQLHAQVRTSANGERQLSIMTGIDGFRLVADRTGNYAPGRDTTYAYDAEGKLLSATAYVQKRTADGAWHEVAATAFFDEYAARRRDGQLNQFWATKPHIMTQKCAESLALRRAFPQELSGLYTTDEMQQADNPPLVVVERAPDAPVALAATAGSSPASTRSDRRQDDRTITQPMAKRLYAISKGGKHDDKRVKEWLREVWGYGSSTEVRSRDYDVICWRLAEQASLGSVATDADRQATFERWRIEMAQAAELEREPGAEG